MKTCTLCRESKPLEDFNVDRRAKSGRTSRCKACLSAMAKPVKPHKKLAANRRWRAAHRETAIERVRRWRATHQYVRPAKQPSKSDKEKGKLLGYAHAYEPRDPIVFGPEHSRDFRAGYRAGYKDGTRDAWG